jgi:uncharacterized protein (TIGR04551 family)
MSRLYATLLAAAILFPPLALGQGSAVPPPGSATTPSPAASPGAAARGMAPAPATSASSDVDAATRDAIRREVEKAKEDIRDEVRAEIQGAQSAREFMDSAVVGERTKLDFLQLHGYLRVRGDLQDNFDLRRGPDPSGYFLFPRPLLNSDQRGTLTTGNMRLRVEPTFNVSEQVRVLGQIDMLDNLVLGSTPEGLFTSTTGSQFPVGTWTQVPPSDRVNSDRNSISVKRAWAEVQTPIGLLSFGRMPSSWGLGILAHAGSGIDDDLGDSVDRVQFALTPLSTPVGPLVLVPMYEIVATGVTSVDLRNQHGIGQPFDRDQADDAKAVGLKIVRLDTDEEMKRKLDRGDASYAFGAWYLYKSQSFQLQQWATSASIPSTGQPNEAVNDPVGSSVKRDATAHVLDLWFRRVTKRLRLEAELAGIVGQIGNASNDPSSPLGPVLIRQLGGAAQGAWKLLDGKLTLGGEVGFATGDSNPGLGNRPGRTPNPQRGDIEGAQFHCDPPGTPAGTCDRVLDIRNFRFNPAYRVDLILWRDILQGVTDAWYLKPSARYELIEGLAAQLSIVYSQAMYGSSTPSGVHKPLGIEVDIGLSYQSDDGFIAYLNYGMLQPLDGLREAPGTAVLGREMTRAHAIRTGLAVKF